MSIEVEQLTKHDYMILEFISTSNNVTKKEIIDKLSDKVEALELRISRISRPLSTSSGSYMPDTSYIKENLKPVRTEYGYSEGEPLGVYNITDLGKKVLQDYKSKEKTYKKELWLKNAWIPILVAFLTTVITNYITPRLPQIIQWFSNILLKMTS